ncbi:hypothetical protein RB614_40180 [Phytohabitans sp. ZYX-F-186]|uniref:DUF3558 domain-containing protein n=1 Tax=Phytohabitans maris TaxID=3071409 RepID=A0ABU0ZUW3_9ACTN|nr:hypothetical protein [Phytohabitans sp. ZYX-F-186]MDQ7910733.1 hypothetical protein [Phytohabitans sp. ZYX-F-186]
MRTRVLVPVAVALLFAVAGCGGGSGAAAGEGSDVDLPVAGGDLGTAVPACPFTAEKVAEIVGKPMVDEGNCLFGDGKGVGSVTITMSSQLAGSTTYDYQRKTADESYATVTDVPKGDRAYIAVDDIKAEAVLVGAGGSYTLIMSSLSLDPPAYERALRTMLDALPA